MADPVVKFGLANAVDGEGQPVKTAIFAGENEANEIHCEGPALVGRSDAGDGKAVNIEVVAPLALENDQLKYVSPNKTAFQAHKNGTDQSITLNTNTKVTFTTEVFDVNGKYDAANSRWTPGAGVVLVSATVRLDVDNIAGIPQVMIYKNGSPFLRHIYSARFDVPVSDPSHTVMIVDVADADDFYEIFCRIDDVSGDVEGDSAYTKFCGVVL